MISDKNLSLTKYINVPKVRLQNRETERALWLYSVDDTSTAVLIAFQDIGHVNCAAYVAGIVEGILCCGEFVSEVAFVDWRHSYLTFFA